MGLEGREARAKTVAVLLKVAMQQVEDAGGRNSTLWVQLLHARAYATAQDRAAAPAEQWGQYARVLSADVEGPDWALTDGSRANEERLARKELAEALAGQISAVGNCVDAARLEWIRVSAGTVAWREQLEAGREFLRLCMRAWREVRDGVRARAAKWEQRWQRAEEGSADCMLARRLEIQEGAAQRWHAAEAWAARAVLTYMRLVRASTVSAARKQSSLWQQSQQRMREQSACIRFAGAERYQHVQGQRYTWRAEAEEQRAAGVTSGAAAVIVRRREEREATHQRQQQQRQQRQQPDARRRTDGDCADSDFSAARLPKKRARPDNDQTAAGARDAVGSGAAAPSEAVRPKRARRTDAAIVFTERAYEAFALHVRPIPRRADALTGRLRHARRRKGEG